ncbi:MAG TPA: fumarylacetoacetate hydrolase family protein [Steroidobacteraceae bacterium]|nr:fumarylacetoacetate hydrolase family protein [Steroidobacteraceae bacterium]
MPSTFGLATCSTAGGAPQAALVVGESVLPLAAVAPFLQRQGLELGAVDSTLAVLEHWTRNFPLLQRLADAFTGGQAPELERAAQPLGQVHLHPPVNLPRQVFCSGANYKKHVIQLHMAQTFHLNEGLSQEERLLAGTRMMDERAAKGTPFFFCKAQSAVTGPFDPIVLPADVIQPDWELELGVVIGKPARRVRREEALDYVAGYVIVNDITTRERVNRKDMKEMGMDWVASKCAPTFLPMGPWIVPAAFVPDPQQLQITLELNGHTMQDESTADMIFGVARLVEALSVFCLLQPGDVICTGSPAGNGMHYGRFLQPGDVVEGRITGLGAIRNVCVAEST